MCIFKRFLPTPDDEGDAGAITALRMVFTGPFEVEACEILNVLGLETR